LVARQARLGEFIHEGSPPFNKSLEVLCEDHNGTYVLLLCQFRDGVWQNAKTRRAIEAELIGWRPLPSLPAADRGRAPMDFSVGALLPVDARRTY
jgi:hypothetical protein